MLEVITPSAPPCQVTASSAFGSDRGQLFPRGMGPPPIRPALPRQHDKQLQMFGQRPRDFQPRPLRATPPRPPPNRHPRRRGKPKTAPMAPAVGEKWRDMVIAKPIRREVSSTAIPDKCIGLPPVPLPSLTSVLGSIGKAIRREVFCTLPAQATTQDSQCRDRPCRPIRHRICACTSRTSRQLPAARPARRPRVRKHNAQQWLDRPLIRNHPPPRALQPHKPTPDSHPSFSSSWGVAAAPKIPP